MSSPRRRFSSEYVALASHLLGCLSHPPRLHIILTLSQGEATVGELCEHLDIAQSSASHHLRILRDMALVQDRREGKWVVYALRVETWRAVAHGFFDHLLDGADQVRLQDFTVRRAPRDATPGTVADLRSFG